MWQIKQDSIFVELKIIGVFIGSVCKLMSKRVKYRRAYDSKSRQFSGSKHVKRYSSLVKNVTTYDT